MVISIRRYRAAPALVDELVRRGEEIFFPLVSTVSGFVACHIVDAGDDIMATVTICSDEQGLAEANQRAEEYARIYLADIAPKLSEPEILVGEIRSSKVA